MANVFTSDLHFFHKNICEFGKRPWLQENNTQELIAIWNDNVGKGDTCWHLGDFFFVGSNEKSINQCLEVLEQLNGYVRCIKGNHDPQKLTNALLDRAGVSSVDKMKEIKLNKMKVVMCHYPMVVWNQSHRGSIQLHGHCHGSLHNHGKSIDVGLDGAHERLGKWRFWTESDVLNYASKKLIHAPDMHEINGRG
jgi:calcineurin-like phosphoesterase family protein